MAHVLTPTYVLTTTFRSKPSKKPVINVWGPMTKNQALRLKRAFLKEFEYAYSNWDLGATLTFRISELRSMSDKDIKDVTKRARH